MRVRRQSSSLHWLDLHVPHWRQDPRRGLSDTLLKDALRESADRQGRPTLLSLGGERGSIPEITER